MKRLRIAIAFALAAPLAACTTTSTTSSAVVSAQVAGTAENAYQAFVIAEEKLVSAGKLDSGTFHTHEQAAYSSLLLVRTGQMTVDAFAAQIAAITAGESK